MITVISICVGPCQTVFIFQYHISRSLYLEHWKVILDAWTRGFIFMIKNIFYFLIRMHVNRTNALSCDSGTEDCGSCLSLPVPSLKHLLLIKMLDLPGEQKLKTKHTEQTDTRLPPFVVDKQIPWSRKCTSNGLRLGFLHCLSLC